MEPFFAQHKVFIRTDQRELTDELLLYPRGKHDDLLDGLYYATKKTYAPLHKHENQAEEATFQQKLKKGFGGWLTA